MSYWFPKINIAQHYYHTNIISVFNEQGPSSVQWFVLPVCALFITNTEMKINDYKHRSNIREDHYLLRGGGTMVPPASSSHIRGLSSLFTLRIHFRDLHLVRLSIVTSYVMIPLIFRIFFYFFTLEKQNFHFFKRTGTPLIKSKQHNS